jgi:hypothetical protein
MARVLVNLVSRETTPNFLFIKEMMQLGDELLFISSKIFEERIQWIVNALDYKNCNIKTVVLPDGAEERWSEMVNLIKTELSKDRQYIVNLTCGTKYMISAVPKAFDGFDAEFFYIPFPKNIILKINDETSKDITYRMSVKEYFDCNNTQIPNQKKLTQSEEYTKNFFEKFIEGKLDFNVIDKLRGYREKNIDTISKIETEGIPKIKPSSREYPKVENLSVFLNDIDFLLQEDMKLSEYETQYITGGWFEEYVYLIIKEQIKPNDIALGVGLPISENRQVSKRDLDVVFTFENKLFVIECKTGIDKEAILVETVYKAAALKNERLGKLSAHTSIFSLSTENQQFSDIAKAMNITYYDRSYFVGKDNFQKIIRDINKKAKG